MADSLVLTIFSFTRQDVRLTGVRDMTAAGLNLVVEEYSRLNPEWRA